MRRYLSFWVLIFSLLFLSLSEGMENLPRGAYQFRPDSAYWLTCRSQFNDGRTIDTADYAIAFFDSAGFGLDAGTCTIDDREMRKRTDTTPGILYFLSGQEGFKFFFDYLYRFRAEGRGSIPAINDTLRSPLADIRIEAPRPNETLRVGEGLLVKWASSGRENNIFIRISGSGRPPLNYYPVFDSARFFIPVESLRLFSSGPLSFTLGRKNRKLFSLPQFRLIALSIVEENLTLYPPSGIEERSPSLFAQKRDLGFEVYDASGKRVREVKGKGVYFSRVRVEGRNYFRKFVFFR